MSGEVQNPKPRYVFDSIRDDVDERKLRVLHALLEDAPPSLENVSSMPQMRGIALMAVLWLIALILWAVVLIGKLG